MIRSALSLAVATLLAGAACQTFAGPGFDGCPPPTGPAGRVVLTHAYDSTCWPADQVQIRTAALSGDTLTLGVVYGGGCRTHEFRLIASTAWMESHPVQVRARLAHDANGDMCRALLSEDLKIDLSPMKTRFAQMYQTSTGSIALLLEGSPAAIVYQF